MKKAVKLTTYTVTIPVTGTLFLLSTKKVKHGIIEIHPLKLLQSIIIIFLMIFVTLYIFGEFEKYKEEWSICPYSFHP